MRDAGSRVAGGRGSCAVKANAVAAVNNERKKTAVKKLGWMERERGRAGECWYGAGITTRVKEVVWWFGVGERRYGARNN